MLTYNLEKNPRRPLIIFGLGDLAQIALEYFSLYTPYQIVGFVVDRDYLPVNKPAWTLNLPVTAFEDTLPGGGDIYISVVYDNMNRTRETKCAEAKLKGYKLASFIHPNATISSSAKIGEHCFVFEDNTIQPYVTIEDNCILWSGNHIGHHSHIHSSCFISSHVVVSGHCVIESNCFLGVNSTMANNTTIGKESWISHGSIMSGNIPPHSLVKPATGNTEVVPLNEKSLARSLARARV